MLLPEAVGGVTSGGVRTGRPDEEGGDDSLAGRYASDGGLKVKDGGSVAGGGDGSGTLTYSVSVSPGPDLCHL